MWKLYSILQQGKHFQVCRKLKTNISSSEQFCLFPTNTYCIDWTHLLSCTVLGMEPRAKPPRPVLTPVTPLPGRSEEGGQRPKGARELLLGACRPASRL